MELLKEAWLGWQNYKAYGKFAALFLLAILYLVMAPFKRTDEIKRIEIYGIVSAVCCIFPPAAAVLLCYQTRFYNYEWLWSIVPVTLVIALVGTLFLTERTRPGKTKRDRCYNAALIGMLAGMLVLSGRLGEDTWGLGTERQRRAEAESVLAIVSEGSPGEEICLWAPKDILEYARISDGNIRLLYGRNMWDNSLNAYCYDKYSVELDNLYLWMEHAAENGRWTRNVRLAVSETGEKEEIAEKMNGAEQVECAFRLGANRVLLKDNFTKTSKKSMKKYVEENDLEMQQIEGYYLLKKR